MSLQLVHTSYPHLLDVSSPGYGTVARSENMPRALISKLTAISVLREPRGGSCTMGPQFSYRIIDLAGAAWHVLSCVQPSGADYSGRACHTAHHFVLSQQEVAGLLKSELRPTPAGITLALQRSGFWVQKWQGEPRYIIGEPHMKPEYLPDATVQPTWKHITGHKSNARAFFTHPYDRECLITLPKGIPSTEVLGLFHESDWLTPTLGWGVTYTTESDDADSFVDTLRMVTSEQSPLVQRTIRTGHPVLRITADMELPMEPVAQRPVEDKSQAKAAEVPQNGDVRVLPRSVNHYHYTEEPDWMLYDVPMPGSNPYLLPLAAAGSIILLAGISVGIWLGLSQPMQMLDEYVTGSACTAPVSVQMPGVQKLQNLLLSPYNHESTLSVLEEMLSMQETAPEDTLLIECARLIRYADTDDTDHAAALKRLCECARLLGLKEDALGKLYMQEATRNLAPEAWHTRISNQNAQVWTDLRLAEQALFNIFEDNPELKPYEPGIYDYHAPTTELATADSASRNAEQAPADEEESLQVRGTHPAVCGTPVPDALGVILNNLPVSVSSGYYCVSEFRTGDTLQPAQRLELSPSGYRLYITPTEKEGEYCLKPEHAEGRKADIPAVRFKIRNNKIQKIECGNNEAVVSFPVPVDEHTLTNVIMAPRIAIPIPSGNAISFPAAEKLDFLISPENLSISAPDSNSETYTLKIRKRSKEFPWVLGKKHIERIEFTVKLPVIIKENGIVETHDDSTSYIWKEAVVVNEDKRMTRLRCEVEHRPDLPGHLDYILNRIANSPCCGDDSVKNKSLNLAHLYYIGVRMADNKLKNAQRDKLCQDYFNLMVHRRFNAEVQKVMQSAPLLLISPEQAKSSTGAASRARHNLKAQLKESTGAQFIIMNVCNVLRESLKEAYRQEIRNFAADSRKKHLLVLRKLSQGSGGELLWHFHLQTGK